MKPPVFKFVALYEFMVRSLCKEVESILEQPEKQLLPKPGVPFKVMDVIDVASLNAFVAILSTIELNVILVTSVILAKAVEPFPILNIETPPSELGIVSEDINEPDTLVILVSLGLGALAPVLLM